METREILKTVVNGWETYRIHYLILCTMTNGIKVIVAGSRTFNDYELLKAELNILIAPNVFDRDIEIVSGCCKGADTLGEQYAKEYGFKVKKFPAEWATYGKKAAYLRNSHMAEYATHCVCFWDGESKGTKMMIDLAKANNLNTHVINY